MSPFEKDAHHSNLHEQACVAPAMPSCILPPQLRSGAHQSGAIHKSKKGDNQPPMPLALVLTRMTGAAKKFGLDRCRTQISPGWRWALKFKSNPRQSHSDLRRGGRKRLLSKSHLSNSEFFGQTFQHFVGTVSKLGVRCHKPRNFHAGDGRRNLGYCSRKRASSRPSSTA
jgi:hypothetical protein